MSDYDNFAASVDTFGRRSMAVTPSDTVDLPQKAKAVVVLTAGTLAIVPHSDAVGDDIDPVEFGEVPTGFIPPFLVRRVMATNTTATVRAVID